MKKLLLLLFLTTLPTFAVEKDMYGVPYCTSKTDYYCHVKNNHDSGLHWYQVIEQRWTNNGTELKNQIVEMGFEFPYQSYEKLKYDFKIKTVEQINNEWEQELKQRQKEQQEYELQEKKKKEQQDSLKRIIANNKQIPVKQFTTQEKNAQWATDFCLRDVLECTNAAYDYAVAGWYGEKLNKQGYLDMAGNEKLYSEIFSFYAITYKNRWRNGYYIQAHPALWQYGRPN